MASAVLTLNAGLSSIEFALFETDAAVLRLVTRGAIEEIGTAPHFLARDVQNVTLSDQMLGDEVSTHEALLGRLLDWVDQHLGGHALIGVAHRVVHGGPHQDRPVLVTDALLGYVLVHAFGAVMDNPDLLVTAVVRGGHDDHAVRHGRAEPNEPVAFVPGRRALPAEPPAGRQRTRRALHVAAGKA